MSTITCRCARTYPLVANVTLRRPVGLRLAQLCCPWCGYDPVYPLTREMWDVWSAGVALFEDELARDARVLVAEVERAS